METPRSWQDLRSLIRSVSEKGLFHLFGANFLTQVIGFAAQMFLAGILTPLEIGRIRILQTYAATAGMAAKAGLDSSTLKLCSEVRAENVKRRIFTTGLLGATAASLLVLAVVLALNGWNTLTGDPDLRALFWWYLPLVPLQALNDLVTFYFQARKEFREVSTIQMVSRTVNLLLIIGATILLGIKGYVLGVVVGAAGILFWLLWKVRAHLITPTMQDVRENLRLHWPYAKLSMGANAIAQLLLYLEVFFLNYLVSDRVAIGYYGFALTLMVPFATLTGTIQQWMTPSFSAASTDRQSWMVLYYRYQRVVAVGGVFLAAVGAVLVPPMVTLVFHEKYAPSTPIFYILLLAWSARMIYMSKGIALWGLGYIHYNLAALAIAFPISLIVTYLCVHWYGVLGAAWASVLTQVLTGVLITMFLSRILTTRNEPS